MKVSDIRLQFAAALAILKVDGPAVVKSMAPVVSLGAIYQFASTADQSVVYVPFAIGLVTVIMWFRLMRVRPTQRFYRPSLVTAGLLAGDCVLTALALWASTFGWVSIPPGTWPQSVWWIIGAAGVGYFFARVQQVRERRGMIGLGERSIMRKEFARWRHQVVLPVQLTGMVYMALPLLFYGRWPMATVTATSMVALAVIHHTHANSKIDIALTTQLQKEERLA